VEVNNGGQVLDLAAVLLVGRPDGGQPGAASWRV